MSPNTDIMTYFSACCKNVLVTLRNSANFTYGPSGSEGIYTCNRSYKRLKTTRPGFGLRCKAIYCVKLGSDSNDHFVIWYITKALGWGIGPISGVNKAKPSLITEKDPSSFQKCPHDPSLTWMHEYGDGKYIGTDVISVECSLPIDLMRSRRCK